MGFGFGGGGGGRLLQVAEKMGGGLRWLEFVLGRIGPYDSWLIEAKNVTNQTNFSYYEVDPLKKSYYEVETEIMS